MPEFPLPLLARGRATALVVVAVGCALAVSGCGPGSSSSDDGAATSEARVVPTDRTGPGSAAGAEMGAEDAPMPGDPTSDGPSATDPVEAPGDAVAAPGSDPGGAGRPRGGAAVDTSSLADPAVAAADEREATDATERGGASRDDVDAYAGEQDPAGGGADPGEVAAADGTDTVPGEAGSAAAERTPDAGRLPGERELLPPDAATDRGRPAAIPSPAALRPREPLTVPAGSELELRMERELTTRDARTGEAFHASLADDVLGLGGVVLLPAGARVRGRVVESRPSEGPGDPAVLTLAVEELLLDGAQLPLEGEVVDVDVERGVRDAGRESAAKVGLGAVAGAVLGKLLGGDDKDALRGAAAGAAAGAAVAIATRDGHAVIGEGAVLRVRLDRALRVERR